MSADPESFAQFDITEHEKDKLVGDVIRYILFKTEQSSGCPIRREDLTQLITGQNYRQRNLPGFVINEAKSKLSNIFGYEMREIQRARASQSLQSAVAGDAKSYIIVSQLPAKTYKQFVENRDSSHWTGFTFIVIGIIHLAAGRITEENLWHHLRRLGLNENDENHPTFGNIKQALEALVQQRYLQKEKVNGPEGNILYYELAERALDGAINDSVKEYISQIVQKDSTTFGAD